MLLLSKRVWFVMGTPLGLPEVFSGTLWDSYPVSASGHCKESKANGSQLREHKGWDCHLRQFESNSGYKVLSTRNDFWHVEKNLSSVSQWLLSREWNWMLSKKSPGLRREPIFPHLFLVSLKNYSCLPQWGLVAFYCILAEWISFWSLRRVNTEFVSTLKRQELLCLLSSMFFVSTTVVLSSWGGVIFASRAHWSYLEMLWLSQLGREGTAGISGDAAKRLAMPGTVPHPKDPVPNVSSTASEKPGSVWTSFLPTSTHFL